jgi:hypothetical protein
MITRDAVLVSRETLTDTQVRTVDLDVDEMISAIEVEIECTNGATNNQGNWPQDITALLEVIDGSDVITSLTGRQAAGLYAYKTGRLPLMDFSEDAAAVQRGSMPILFGRKLWDTSYALDPTRFKNPQLRITMNKAAITAAGATGYAAGNNITCTVVAKVAKAGISPVGFMQARQLHTFTSAAAGEQVVDLPTDYVWHLLMARIYELGTAMQTSITDLRLQMNARAYEPINRRLRELDRLAREMFGQWTLPYVFHAQNADTALVPFHQELGLSLMNQTAGASSIHGLTAFAGSQATLVFQTDAGADIAADEAARAMMVGHAPFGCLPIVLGDLHDPNTWFDPRGYKKAEIVYTQGNAGAAVETVLEQIRA